MQVQASLQHHLSFRNEAYILTLHADAAGAQTALTLSPVMHPPTHAQTAISAGAGCNAAMRWKVIL